MAYRAWGVLCFAAACGDNLAVTTPTPCALTRGGFMGVEVLGVSADGANVAFLGNGALNVTDNQCEGETVQVATGITHAWFCGNTLLGFRDPYTPDTAALLFAWNPQQGTQSIAAEIDPTATHCSPDGTAFTTEVNDVTDDGNTSVTLMVVDTRSLRTLFTSRLDQPRARFTHDSQRLLILSTQLGTYQLEQLAIGAGGPPTPVATIAHSRFEISADDRYVVYTDLNKVVRLDLADKSKRFLAEDHIDIPGTDHALAADDIEVYFSGTPAAPLLQATHLDGRSPPYLLSSASALVAHVPGLVLYTRTSGLRLMASDGGTPALVNASTLVDSTSDRLLLVGAQTIVIDVPSGDEHAIDRVFTTAALTHNHRVVGRMTDTSVREVYPGNQLLLAETTGPFVLDPTRRQLFAPVVDPRDAELQDVVAVEVPDRLR